MPIFTSTPKKFIQLTHKKFKDPDQKQIGGKIPRLESKLNLGINTFRILVFLIQERKYYHFLVLQSKPIPETNVTMIAFVATTTAYTHETFTIHYYLNIGI